MRNMGVPYESNEKISFVEFLKMRENTDKLLEYIDGVVFMSPSPSTKHQRISSRLHAAFFSFLQGKSCEVFPAPFNIELKTVNEFEFGTKVVVPDLSIICDSSRLEENKYVGAPELIVEIVSPSNSSYDYTVKHALYASNGVKEYWIVNPMKEVVQVYILEGEGYTLEDVAKGAGVISSKILEGFCIDLGYLFE